MDFQIRLGFIDIGDFNENQERKYFCGLGLVRKSLMEEVGLEFGFEDWIGFRGNRRQVKVRGVRRLTLQVACDIVYILFKVEVIWKVVVK